MQSGMGGHPSGEGWFIWSEGSLQTVMQVLVCQGSTTTSFYGIHVRETGFASIRWTEHSTNTASLFAFGNISASMQSIQNLITFSFSYVCLSSDDNCMSMISSYREPSSSNVRNSCAFHVRCVFFGKWILHKMQHHCGHVQFIESCYKVIHQFIHKLRHWQDNFGTCGWFNKVTECGKMEHPVSQIGVSFFTNAVRFSMRSTSFIPPL